MVFLNPEDRLIAAVTRYRVPLVVMEYSVTDTRSSPFSSVTTITCRHLCQVGGTFSNSKIVVY